MIIKKVDLNQCLNYESLFLHQYNIFVEDQGNPKLRSSVVVQVTVLTDAQQLAWIRTPYLSFISEERAVGFLIATAETNQVVTAIYGLV